MTKNSTHDRQIQGFKGSISHLEDRNKFGRRIQRIPECHTIVCQKMK